MKKFTSKSQKIGEIGETIACRYLVRRGYRIVCRNYTKKWGEIDIVAERSGMTHFIEVKSVSCESLVRPEDQVSRIKQGRLIRTILSYVREHDVGAWQFDVLCLYLDLETRSGKLKALPDIVLERP